MTILGYGPGTKTASIRSSDLSKLIDATLVGQSDQRPDPAKYIEAAQLAGLSGCHVVDTLRGSSSLRMLDSYNGSKEQPLLHTVRLTGPGIVPTCSVGPSFETGQLLVRIEVGATIRSKQMVRAVSKVRALWPGASLILATASPKIANRAEELGFSLVEYRLCASMAFAPMIFQRVSSPVTLIALAEIARLSLGHTGPERLLTHYWAWLGCPQLVRRWLRETQVCGDCVWSATWEWAFGRAISQSDHARVLIRRTNDGERRIRKIALGDLPAFTRELTRHRSGRFLRQPLAPVIGSGTVNGALYYETPYYNGGTLRDRLRSADFNLKESLPQVLLAVRGLCNGFFKQIGTSNPNDFARSALVARPLERLPLVREHQKGNMEWRCADVLALGDVARLFESVALANTVVINGKLHPGPRRLISMLETELSAFIPPSTSIRQLHGDAHFGNILFDDEGNAVFVDAGGFLDGGDVAYDIGKMTVSLEWHDLYLDGLGAAPQLRFDGESVEISGHRCARLPAHASQLDATRRAVLLETYSMVEACLKAPDKTLAKRVAIYAGVHQIAMAPTLLRRFGWRAITILVEGILTTNLALMMATRQRER
jgi:hypothetical protein